MATLFLDTSGACSTVAVMRGRELLGASAIRGRPAARLHDQIRTTLREAGVALSELESIGIVVGPGSWTGLNIGVTAAKTLAQVLGICVLPISSLDALVAGFRWTGGRVCALLSAGRSRVYRAWYGTCSSGAIVLADQDPAVVTVEALEQEISLQDGLQLLVEYGHVVGPTLYAPCALKHSQRLSPEDMAAAAASVAPLSSDEALTLTPTYMQSSLAERDAAK